MDIVGTHHLSYLQQVGGVAVFGNGVKVHITKAGQIVSVDRSPVANLPASLGGPKLTASQARDAALDNVFVGRTASVAKTEVGAARATTFSDGDSAKLVVFQTLGGPRLGWQVINARHGWVIVVDLTSGRPRARTAATRWPSSHAG